MKIILLSCVIAFISFKTFAQTTIEAKEAAKHINEKVTICDKVFGGKFFTNSGLTLLDLGGSHPNELLTIVIKAEDRKKFKIAPETDLKDKKVCVTGQVIDYKGKPEIIITDPEQIKVQ